MITLVESEADQQRLLDLCERSAFGCKIFSLADAYGFDKGFSSFWIDSETEAVFALSDGVMLIDRTPANGAEAEEFLRAVGAGAVMCALRTAEALGLQPGQTGEVLKKAASGTGESGHDPFAEINIRAIYGLLSDTDMVDEFEPFYLDLSHRLRHGAARVFTRFENEHLVGCSIVSSISRTTAVLSAVAVAEESRRKGIGSALVKEAEAALAGKTVYVLREKGAHKEFYKALGYQWCDAWTYTELH